ncbi:MAG: hypothetical protein GY810_25415 [Aureispira sp.]|nr:hypothetical protein [Aureispira sp.]
MTIRIQKERLWKGGLLMITLLLLFNLLVILRLSYQDRIFVNEWEYLFNFNNEANLPTYFSTALLLLAALLLGAIGRTVETKVHWYILSGVFLFLAVDELAQIHERFGVVGEWMLDLHGVPKGLFYYAWVIPYGFFTACLAVLMLDFLRTLPLIISRLIILSAVVFLSGAIGMEMISGWHIEKEGLTQFYYVLTTIEELLEMLGVLLFNYTLVLYIEQHLGAVHANWVNIEVGELYLV